MALSPGSAWGQRPRRIGPTTGAPVADRRMREAHRLSLRPVATGAGRWKQGDAELVEVVFPETYEPYADKAVAVNRMRTPTMVEWTGVVQDAAHDDVVTIHVVRRNEWTNRVIYLRSSTAGVTIHVRVY